MSLGHAAWKGRRKRLARRLAHDLRALAPLVAIVCCFLGAASTIFAAESRSVRTPADVDAPAPARGQAECGTMEPTVELETRG